MRGRRSWRFLLLLLAALAAASPASGDEQATARHAGKGKRHVYRFVVRKSGLGRTWIRGAFSVDGAVRVVTRARTPYRFQCEAGQRIHGFFEAIDPEKSLTLKVYAPDESRRWSVAMAGGLRYIQFSWGVDTSLPRCVSGREEKCPSGDPPFSELRRMLQEALRQEEGRKVTHE